MIKRNNKERVIEEINENRLENIFNIVPNLADKVLDYVEEKYNITKMVSETIEDRRKKASDIPMNLVLLSSVSAKMKQLYAITELPLALTSNKMIENMQLNIYFDVKEGLLKEANIRAILKKYDHDKNEKLEYNNYFVNYFNEFNYELLSKAKIDCNIHIYDCSVLEVCLENEKYEGSSITTKDGVKKKGYKIGTLRGATPNGGVIEEITMSTAKEHDFSMSKDSILNSKYLKEGDYLLEDRGFLDIDQFKKLNKKGIFVITPAKKNMEIYINAVEMAKKQNNWKKHLNSKRKGQEITLVTNMERAWLNRSDQNKKPENLKLDYKINCCVIKFEIEKNKKLLTDEEILSSDGQYAYAVIMTNNIDLSCDEIIRLYEQRPEIEEDFRQLKDFWGLTEFRSTRYNLISFSIISTLMGYNFYQLFKEDEIGKDYIGKNYITENKHGMIIVKSVYVAIVTEHYFGIFKQTELLDLYVALDKKKRELIKNYLIL